MRLKNDYYNRHYRRRGVVQALITKLHTHLLDLEFKKPGKIDVFWDIYIYRYIC